MVGARPLQVVGALLELEDETELFDDEEEDTEEADDDDELLLDEELTLELLEEDELELDELLLEGLSQPSARSAISRAVSA